ncbi:MAG: NADPH-dependent FMN reductase [Myxococcota bacterium]|nr:NAD(P)H-dependent oxidoreductase [Myxococcota bacterium]
MKTIAVIVGSLRKDSLNKKLAQAVEALAKDLWTCRYADIGALPLYNEDLWPSPPAPVGALKQLIESSDGVLVVTPEYNRSVPGVLKNALDWASRPSGKSSFKHKPAAVLGASSGQVGTAVAQAHLRGILGPSGATPMQSPEVYITAKEGLFDAGGAITDEKIRANIQKHIDAFDAWIARLSPD